jgi:SAM-dependent methyltransferase
MPRRSLQTRIKAALKPLAARALRPGLEGLHARFDRIEGFLALEAQEGVKYEGELQYWRYLVKGGGAQKDFGDSFERVFGNWQRNRLRKLAGFLGLAEDQLDDWCHDRSAVEIGSGPYPAMAAARKGWKRCVAVDPIARGYVEEGLVPECCSHVVFVAAKGEQIPLPSLSADLLICENCLDHVSDPVAVVSEMFRLLQPGGHLWFFVDLSNHVDHMHPHAMNEAKVQDLLARGGFVTVREEVSKHKAHPQAYGGLRGLYRRPLLTDAARVQPEARATVNVIAHPVQPAQPAAQAPANAALNGSAAGH